MRIINAVTFFGSSTVSDQSSEFQAAKQIAAIVAKSDRKVVNGGGSGIMLAATLGAQGAGGQTSVVYYEPELATTFEGKEIHNFADTQYKEANYVNRTQKLLELGDLYIIFNGGSGTISEFGMAWGLARLYFGHHKPLILFGEFWENIMDAFKKNMMIRKEEFEVFKIISSPQEVIPTIEAFEKIITHNRHNHPEDPNNKESFLLL